MMPLSSVAFFCSSEAAQQPGIFTLRSSSHMDPTTVALLQESENTAIGIRVQYHSLKRVAHPPHPENADYSSYSDEWTWLVRSEWFKMPVTIKATDASENDLQVNQDIKPMFHGTEWGSALQICASGMFIVGAGTHGIRGKSKSGCWCVPTLPDALVRADPRRYAQGPVEYSRLCCPVVLELRAATLIRVPGTTKHCAPGSIGAVHRGIVIDAVHFNIRLMQNFMRLETPQARQALCKNPTTCRLCACNICGLYSDPADPNFYDWRKSGAGFYYDARCYRRVRAEVRCIF